MKSRVSLILLSFAAALPAVAQEPPPGDGPRGSSQLGAGEVRYDAVGYAGPAARAGVSALSAVLPAGSHAEVTALDSGRTIVVAVVAGDVAPGRVLMLSDAAAAALGMTGDGFAMRVRKVTPTPQDIVALRDGQAASFRADAPSALLVALRRKLPSPGKALKPATAKPVTKTASPPPAHVATAGYVVQVAALSTPARAARVAEAVGGAILPGPPLWRVRLGPFPDSATAARAAADARRRGYSGAQIVRIP